MNDDERRERSADDDDRNPERQGPQTDGPKPGDAPAPPPADQEPPPESIPGDSGQVPNPQQR